MGNDGSAFVINDSIELTKLLPVYFRTTKLSSFMRQLHTYNFRTISKGAIKEYNNPNFNRGQFHDMLKVGISENLSDADEIEQLKTATNILAQKYDELWLAAVNLEKQISYKINKNVEEIKTIVEFKFYFAERMKIMVMLQTINVHFHDRSTFEGIGNLIKQQSYIRSQNLESYVEEFTHFSISPETLTLHVKKTLIPRLNYSSYISKIVRAALKPFNNKNFQLPAKKMYTSILKYILRNEIDDDLLNHKSFYVLTQVKTICNEIYEIVMDDMNSIDTSHMFQGMNKTHRIEILPYHDDYPENSCGTSFSLRTLNSQFGLNNIDLFMFLRPDFDE